MESGVVISNLLDMRAEPSHDSERVNQALFGENVTITKKSGKFSFIKQTDGYQGWVASQFVRSAPPAKPANVIITAKTAKLYGPNRKATAWPHFLYYGNRVCVRRGNDGWGKLILPYENRVFLKQRAFQPIGVQRATLTGAKVLAQARRFVGVSYLWGGVSPAGFDCSGMVRAIFSIFGIDLPRDTKDQIKIGLPIKRDEIETGDLMFFDRHVGIAIGATQIIHASRGGGGVRINSIDSGGKDYREDLDQQFVQARRIL